MTLGWAPATGDVLDPQKYARNFYRLNSGTSILEVGNGNLTEVNFDPAFEVLPHHAREGEKGFLWTNGYVIPNDYFSDLYGSDSASYIAVVGCGITFRVRYTVSIAHFHVGAFASHWRQFGPSDPAGAHSAFQDHLSAPEIRVRMFMVDPGGTYKGSALDYTRRDLPQSVYFSTASFDPDAEIQMSEASVCRHWNLMHTRGAGLSSPNGPLTPGIYTVGLAVIVPRNLFGQNTDNATNPDEDMKLALNGGGVDPRPLTYYSAIQRIRFYTRNITGVALL